MFTVKEDIIYRMVPFCLEGNTEEHFTEGVQLTLDHHNMMKSTNNGSTLMIPAAVIFL